MLKTVSASLLTLAIALVPAARHEAVDNEMNARIRKEGKEHSHIHADDALPHRRVRAAA